MAIDESSKVAERAFAALHRRLSLFDSRSRQRGIQYWRGGAVGELQFSAGQVRADVHGTRVYDSGWSFASGEWHPECDCPVGPLCKHAYAMALHVLELAETDPDVETDELSLLFAGPGAAKVPVKPPKPIAHRPAMPAVRRAITGPPARPEPKARRDTLHILRTPGNAMLRYQTLVRMLPVNATYVAGIDPNELHRVLRLDDPDRMCWELARLLARHQVAAIPPELAAFAERKDIAERVGAERAHTLRRELADWASRRTAVAAEDRSLRLVLSFAPGRPIGHVILVEPRLTSPRMADQPRSFEQLRQFRYSLRTVRTTLPDDQLELLDALVRAHEEDQAGSYGIGEPTSHLSPLARLLLGTLPSPHVRWSEQLHEPEFARVGVVPGEVVRFDSAPAELIPNLTNGPDGALQLALMIRRPDGSQRPVSDALLICSRSQRAPERLFAVLQEGVLAPLRSALPDELVQGFLSAPALPIERHEAAGIVRLLSNALPAARAAYEAHVATHRVRVIVALDLDGDDRLDFRLFALTLGLTWRNTAPLPAGEHMFELEPNGQWREFVPDAAAADGPAPDAPAADDPPTAAATEIDSALLHVPDADCVRAGLEWLQSTGAKLVEVAPGYFRRLVRLTPRTVPALAEAWDRRPAAIDWVGTKSVQALFGPGAAFRARVSAKRFGVDLLTVSAQWESELLTLRDADIARLRTATTPWVKLSGGWVRRDGVDMMDETLEVLADLGIEPGAGEQPLTLWQLAQAKPESLDALERLGLDESSVQAVRELRKKVASFAGLPSVALPRGFKGELRPYQRQGLDFLAWTASLGMGAVLADDMGLGKTVQALAWLLHLRAGTRRKGPALVVCPASVVHNWEREARTFAPGLRVQTLTSGPERAAQLERLAKYDLVITNYALLRYDADAWREQSLFATIVDEAQMIKNPAAEISKLVCELRSTHRLALTGTPLENRALDLWSIVRFVNPGYLGSERDFLARFDRADAPPQARRLLSAKLRPILLRRLKREVAPELPERVEERRDCEMSSGQRKLYLAELKRARNEMAAMAAAGGLSKHKIQILAALTRLRQICCHPALAGGAANVPSGKFDALFELLEPLLAEGHKVLVFSQFVRALELVKAELKKRRVTHFELTGSTTNRPRVVKAFEQCEEACVFLISLRAGGTGLNLTAANYVVLLDPWWNPAVEAQAIDRTHRIGQDRTVIAYRLLMQGTIEERIWELQQRKAALVSDVLGEDGFAKALDRDALDYLFAEG